MKQLNFGTGFTRIEVIIDWVLGALFLLLLVLMIMNLPSVDSERYWPFLRFYQDDFILLFVVATLAYPIISFVLLLPIWMIRWILFGFVVEPHESLPQAEWKLFRAYQVCTEAANYGVRLIPWAIILVLLLAVDRNEWIDQTLQWALRSLGVRIGTVRYAVYALLVLTWLILRFLSALIVGSYIEMKITAEFENLIGRDGVKRISDYSNVLAERNGMAFLRFFAKR